MNLEEATTFVEKRWHEIDRVHQKDILHELCWMICTVSVDPDEWKTFKINFLRIVRKAKVWVDLEI